MPKYRVKYVYERWYDLEIEAESEEKAREIFDSVDFQGEPRLVGGEIQDSVVIEETEEVRV
jgi:hypothetical protein